MKVNDDDNRTGDGLHSLVLAATLGCHGRAGKG